MLRKKLFLNLVIILICGTVALSLPIIVQQMRKPAQATKAYPSVDWELVSVFVGGQVQDTADVYVVWQIEQRCGDTVIRTWEQIYASIRGSNPLSYDKEHLKLTRAGLVYAGLTSTDDYQILYTNGYRSIVTYQGKSCELKLG